MRSTSPLHTCIAVILLAAMFFSMTSGLVAPKTVKAQDSPVLSQRVGEYSLTAGDGCGGGHQPVEYSHHDQNPSCCHRAELPAYSPVVACLYVPEPLTKPPLVYYDRFVPPQQVA